MRELEDNNEILRLMCLLQVLCEYLKRRLIKEDDDSVVEEKRIKKTIVAMYKLDALIKVFQF